MGIDALVLRIDRFSSGLWGWMNERRAIHRAGLSKRFRHRDHNGESIPKSMPEWLEGPELLGGGTRHEETL